MEEILKSLQGKSMTKKSLFDFLSEINIEEISTDKPKNTIIYKDELVQDHIQQKKCKEKKIKEKKPPAEFKCEACIRIFSTQKYLDKHYNNNVVCKKWIELPKKPSMLKLTKGIHLIIDDLLENAITDNNKLECKFCKYIFSTKGNLHKHFNTSALCNGMACSEFKIVVSNFNT
jgi:hypothetical protein